MSTTVELALGPDDDGSLIADTLAAATESLDIALYELGPGWAKEVREVAWRGVRTRVLVDEHAGASTRSAAILAHCGAEMRHAGAGATELHCKLLMACGVEASRRIAVGTGNLIDRDAPRPVAKHPEGVLLPGTREWWASVEADEDDPTVAAAGAFFEGRWRSAREVPSARRRVARGTAPPVNVPEPAVGRLRLAIAPEALTLACGARDCARLLLRSAEHGARGGGDVDLIAPYVHARAPAVADLVERLGSLVAAGSRVRLLLGTPVGAGDDVASVAGRGIEVRVLDPRATTTGHAKGLVAAGRVVVSSANLSGAGLEVNDEVALAVDDPRAARYFGDAFERDWTSAAELDDAPATPS